MLPLQTPSFDRENTAELHINTTVWHEIFVGSIFREFHGFFIDSRKLNPVKTNSRQKSPRKFTPFNYIAVFQ